MFFQFIWNNGPEKIKREILYQSKNNGGLAMMNILTFSYSLKISWIRRLFNFNSKWKDIAIKTFNKLYNLANYGSDFTLQLSSSSLNKFWCDVFSAYTASSDKIESAFKIQVDEVNFMYNKFFKVDKQSIYSTELEKNGIFKIKHLKIENYFMTYHDFKTKYQSIKINYLHYHALISSLKKGIKVIESSNQHKNHTSYNGWQVIFKEEKGVKLVYKSLIQTNTIPTGIKKWHKYNENFNYHEALRNLYKTTKDTKLIWLQYRIIHHILTTNRSVSKYNKSQSDKCQFCKKESEHISHILYECPETQHFWNELINKINTRCSHANNLKFLKAQVLFGIDNNYMKTDNTLNLIILMGKQYVYRCKFQNRLPQIREFISNIYDRYVMERAMSCSKGERPAVFNLKWANYTSLFQGLA